MEYVGSSYQGDWKDGRFEGKGKYNFPTGTRYEGDLKDGMFHGKGTLYFENGGKYEAKWVEGIAVEVFNIDKFNFKLIISRFDLRVNIHSPTASNSPRKTGSTVTATTDDSIPRYAKASSRQVVVNILIILNNF